MTPKVNLEKVMDDYNQIPENPEDQNDDLTQSSTQSSGGNAKPFDGPNVVEIEGEKFFSDGNGGKWYDNEALGKFHFNFKKLMKFAGPGLLMSIAYLDPGNIQGDMQAGIDGQYSLLWALLWSTVLGLYYQVLSAKIGITTQKNLARVCKEQYRPLTRYALWIMTEIAIIGADIQEVIGSATAIKILLGWPLWVGVILTIVDSFLFLFIHYYGVRKLEMFFLFLIGTMTIMFFSNMFFSQPNYGLMAEGTLIPSVPKGAWPSTLGLIGAVIMPHNLYLHSSLVLSRKIDHKNRSAVNDANIYNTIESAMSLALSFFISCAVISTFAVYSARDPDSNDDINLYKAADILADTLGNKARYIWAIGLLAAGQSATMTGTYAGQFVMEGFLDWKLPVYQRVLITRLVSIAPAAIVAFFDESRLDTMDGLLNILQSVQLPFALVPLVKFAASPEIMKEFAIPAWQYIPASLFGVGLFSMNFVLLFIGEKYEAWQYGIIGVCVLFYLFFIFMACYEKMTPLKPIGEDDYEIGQIDVEKELQQLKKEELKHMIE